MMRPSLGRCVPWPRLAAAWLLLAGAFAPLLGAADALRPTQADVAYGPHERQVLDFHAAQSDRPTPLAICLHGGGFVNGDKRKVPAAERDQLLGRQ